MPMHVFDDDEMLTHTHTHTHTITEGPSSTYAVHERSPPESIECPQSEEDVQHRIGNA